MDINRAFAEPTSRTDDQAEYLPTQMIAACLKEEGYGGILYGSGLSHDGINYALFDPSVADVVDVRLYVVTDINVEAKVYIGTVSI
jgi:hypothetical protein